jgi:hypothetical protein
MSPKSRTRLLFCVLLDFAAAPKGLIQNLGGFEEADHTPRSVTWKKLHEKSCFPNCHGGLKEAADQFILLI